MQFLALITPAAGRSMEQIRARLRPEALHTWERYKAGVVRQMYLMTGGRLGAVLVLECADLATAEGELKAFPLVESGDFVTDCVPIGPFVSWEGLFGGVTG